MLEEIVAAFERGEVIPYLGPGVLSLARSSDLPASPEALVSYLTKTATVPHKIRNNLTAAAQYIENFKHRKTVVAAMNNAFSAPTEPTALHEWLAARPKLPLLVNAWYDDLPQKAFAARDDWGLAQGISQAEHFGEWVHYFRPDGAIVPGKRTTRDSTWREVARGGAAGDSRVEDSAVSAARINHAGGELHCVGLRLCRDSDRNRHSNADP